jgi:uncharacterized protein YdhG (YjbR/CyaY superfamily)
MKKEAQRVAAKNVDEYLLALPAKTRSTLEKVREAIKAAAPKAEEVISYQVPTYKIHGPVAAFAAFEKHCSFFTTSHSVMKMFSEDLKPYYTSGVTIRFPLDKPLPATLIKKLVRAKIKENETRMLSKKTVPAKRK